MNIFNGDKCWYKDDRLHREDGSAYIGSKGFKSWSMHGKLHRLDGPAVISKDFSSRWYYEGKRVYVSYQE